MEDIETEENVMVMEGRKSQKYFFRQFLISTGPWTCIFIVGLSFGASTVFIPQLRAEANSTEAISEAAVSWLPSLLFYAAIPWIILLPIAMEFIGRKYTWMFVCVSNLICFIILYFSINITQIIISQVINGINAGAHFTVSVIIITEYTSPEYRGVFLTVKSAMMFWGILVSNAVGTFFHWKNIAIIGTACSVYSIFITFILPESPYWLNSKNKTDKSYKAHKWLHGTGMQSKKNWQQLINFENKHIKRSKFGLKIKIMDIIKIMRSKQFYKPLLLSILVQNLYTFSGKMVFSVHALDILRKITQDKEISAYTAMLILDCITVISMYIGSMFSKIFARRQMIIAATGSTITFLFAISLYTYLIRLNFLIGSNYVCIALMIGYSVSAACGPLILPQAISAELIPLRLRGFSSCCIDLCLKLTLGSLVRVSPYILNIWGSDGVFLFYGLACTVVLFVIYKYLPETKDKTLHEIADLMKSSDTSKPSISKEEELVLEASMKI